MRKELIYVIAGLYPFASKWAETGTVHIYSDPHFGDEELAAGQVNRPSDQEQIKMINNRVGRKDTLIILGDVGDTGCVKQLRGYKVLICGNHDAGGSNYQRVIQKKKFDKGQYTRDEAIAEMKKLYPGCAYSAEEGFDVAHSPFEFWLITADNKLFDEVYTGVLAISDKILLSHEPMPESVLEALGMINLGGHNHTGKHHPSKRVWNFCAEAIDFTPVNFNQFVKSGALAIAAGPHRGTIDKATAKSKKRGYKYNGK